MDRKHFLRRDASDDWISRSLAIDRQRPKNIGVLRKDLAPDSLATWLVPEMGSMWSRADLDIAFPVQIGQGAVSKNKFHRHVWQLPYSYCR